MKQAGRLVAILLLITVFFIRMASELLGIAGINRYFVGLLGLFCLSALLWLLALFWIDKHEGALVILAATLSLFLIAMEYFYSNNMDLVAVVSAIILLAISLGRGGNSGGEQMHSTMSTYTVAGVASEGAPVSIVRDYIPPQDEDVVEIDENIPQVDSVESDESTSLPEQTGNESVDEELTREDSTKSDAKYVASKRGKYYHRADSEWGVKIKTENRIEFHTKEDAWEAGFRAHRDIEE